MDDLIYNVIERQSKELKFLLEKKYTERIQTTLLEQELSSPLVKVIVGPRRAGKSTIALEALRNKQFAYLNFEDESLPNIDDGDLILRALDKTYKNVDFYLFDEIQNFNRWEQFLNRLHRLGKNLIVTGSNARMLSDELASALTGRHSEIEVLPFSFKEYENISHLNPPDFKQFLHQGGFPEVALENTKHKPYLSTLWDAVILKDIAQRKKIRNILGLNSILSLFLSSIANRFNVESLVKALGGDLSAPTVKKFINYGIESYLIAELIPYSLKPKKRIKSDRKAYCIDNGFFTAKNISLSENLGILLENAVFNELRIRGFKPNFSLFYYMTKSGYEVDFLLRKGHKKY